MTPPASRTASAGPAWKPSVAGDSTVTQDYLKVVWAACEWGGAGASITGLAKRMEVAPSTASENVARLVEEGLLVHKPYRAVTLSEEGRRRAMGMIRRHRILETYLVTQLGFGWDEVHKINPRCIMASLKGFNKGSRFEHVKAFEPVAQSAGGAASTTGWYDGERNVPTQSGAALGDSNSGMHLLIAILSALLQRQRTGEGCYVYQSMQNAVLNLCRVKLRDQLILDRLGKLSYYDCYPNYKWGKAIPRAANAEGGLVLGWCYRAKGWETDQNAYVYIVIQQSKKGFENFCHAMGFEDWITDPRFNTANARDEHKEEVYKRVEEYTMQYDKYTLTKELGAKGVPVGPVLDWNELENDPDLNDDGTIVTIDQQDARGDFKTIGMPFTMSNFTPDYQRAPKLGENNEEILKGLGYSDDQISELLSNGVIGGNDGVKADLK